MSIVNTSSVLDSHKNILCKINALQERVLLTASHTAYKVFLQSKYAMRPFSYGTTTL